MSYVIVGTIREIGPVQVKTDTFKVRDLILVVEKIYKQKDQSYPIKLQCKNDMCDLLDSVSFLDAIRLNIPVTIDFEVDGRDWGDKVITNLNVIKIIINQSQAKMEFNRPSVPSPITPKDSFMPTDNFHTKPDFESNVDKGYADDLPF